MISSGATTTQPWNVICGEKATNFGSSMKNFLAQCRKISRYLVSSYRPLRPGASTAINRTSTKIALVLGKQGSGKTTRVVSALQHSFDFDGRFNQLLDRRNGPQIFGNHYNHIAFDEDGDLVFVEGAHLGKAMCKVKSLQGTYALEFPHSGYIPVGSNSFLNNQLIQSKIFHLELPETVWRSIGGTTGAVTSPEYFMAHGRKLEKRQDCDYERDLLKIRADIARSGVPAARFENPEAMIEPIRDFLMFSRWTDEQLRSFVALKMSKTRPRGYQGKEGLLGYQVVDFGNGIRSDGDAQTPEKLAFLLERANIQVKDHTFMDLGCNMGSVIFELKKRGAADCIGFDVYEPALEIARTINENWFQFPSVEFRSQSIADDWSTALPSIDICDKKVDYALALSVLHKDGVRNSLRQVIRNVARCARNLVAEVPLQGDATDWDYNYLKTLLEESYVVERLPDSDFHSVCKPRALLLCTER